MTPDAQDGDAIGIAAIDDRVVAEHQFPEQGWTIFDGFPEVGEVADSPERGLKDPLIHIALPGAPLLLRVGKDLTNVAVSPRRDDNLNT